MFENLIERIKDDYIHNKCYTADEIKAMIDEADYSGKGEVTIDDFNYLRLALRQVKYDKWGKPTSIDESDIEEFCIKALLKTKPELTANDIGVYLDSLLGRSNNRENTSGRAIHPLGILNKFIYESNHIQQINTQENMERFYRVILKYASYIKECDGGFSLSALPDQFKSGDTFWVSLGRLMENLSPELNLKLYEMTAIDGNNLDIKNISDEERKKHNEVRGGNGWLYSLYMERKINEMYSEKLPEYVNAYQKIKAEGNNSYPHAEQLVHHRLAKLLIRGELIIDQNGDLQEVKKNRWEEIIPKGEPISLGNLLDVINDNDRHGKSFIELFIENLIDRDCSPIVGTTRKKLPDMINGLKKWNNISNLNKWLNDSEHPLHQLLNINQMGIQNPNGYQYFWNGSYNLSYKKEVLKSIILRECEKAATEIYRGQKGEVPQQRGDNSHVNTKKIIAGMEK